MGPRVSLKPVVTAIRNAESKLRKLNRKSSPAQKKEIHSKIKELDLVIRHVSHICRGYNIIFKCKGYNVVIKPK